jgi:hypothetical protein
MNLILDEKMRSQLYDKKILYHTEKIMGAMKTQIGQLICTSDRVLLFLPKILGRYETESFPLDHISYINFKQGMLLGSLVLKTNAGEKKLNNLDKKEGAMMNDIINNQINLSKALASGKTMPNPNPKLELQMMFVNGAISEQEYYRKMMAL